MYYAIGSRYLPKVEMICRYVLERKFLTECVSKVSEKNFCDIERGREREKERKRHGHVLLKSK